MTRKQALDEAIKIVQKYNIKEERKGEIIRKLELCVEELPFARWSRAAVLDACEMYLQTHGALTVGDFHPPALPSRSTLERIFKMSARVFRDAYFPRSSSRCNSPYRHRPPQEWRKCFIEDFYRVQPSSGADYNARRAGELPSWVTVARRLGHKTWRALLADCGLKSGKNTLYCVRRTGVVGVGEENENWISQSRPK